MGPRGFNYLGIIDDVVSAILGTSGSRADRLNHPSLSS